MVVVQRKCGMDKQKSEANCYNIIDPAVSFCEVLAPRSLSNGRAAASF